MSEWKIGGYRVEDHPFTEPVPKVEKLPSWAKPMTWKEWYDEAIRRGYTVREAFHTTSGIYEALDPTTKQQAGMWKPDVGGFKANT